jgi:hypothetical protein
MTDFARRNTIELFDLSEPGWRSSFKAWVDSSREVVA